jgi:acyl dehydratase
MRLLVGGGAPIAGGVIGAGVEVRWRRPVRPGDELQIVSEVMEITPSRSKSDRGIAVLRSATRNQRGEAAQVLTSKLVVPRGPLRVTRAAWVRRVPNGLPRRQTR